MRSNYPMQLEFPFTRNGCLLEYNTAQQEHINDLYREHIRATKNYHYIKDKNTFVEDYVRNGGAKTFSEYYNEVFFDRAVERQNNAVWDRWIDNKLHGNHKIYQTLDKFLNDDDGHLDN